MLLRHLAWQPGPGPILATPKIGKPFETSSRKCIKTSPPKPTDDPRSSKTARDVFKKVHAHISPKACQRPQKQPKQSRRPLRWAKGEPRDPTAEGPRAPKGPHSLSPLCLSVFLSLSLPISLSLSPSLPPGGSPHIWTRSTHARACAGACAHMHTETGKWAQTVRAFSTGTV